MQMKNGIARSIWLLIMPKILIGMSPKNLGLKSPLAIAMVPKITAVPARAKATGYPLNIKTNSDKIMSILSASSIYNVLCFIA